MQSVSSRIWTCVTVSISYDDNYYTTGTSIQEKINHHLYMDDIKLFAINETELAIDTNNKNIQLGYRNGIWYRKMCHAHDKIVFSGLETRVVWSI